MLEMLIQFNNSNFEYLTAMKFKTPVSVESIAQLIGGKVVGDGNAVCSGINEIHKVEAGDLCFVDHPKYYEKCLRSAASYIIIDKAVEETYGKTIIVCDQPFEAYQTIISHFNPFAAVSQSISASASIAATALVMPGAIVGNHVVIGEHSIIFPNAVILDHTIIGNHVTIHSGAVLGADAFYYNTKKNREVWYKKMLSGGHVVIEDDVEIGANTCIDRGVTHETRIGRGTKIDNLVQIGHDVVVGSNCIIAAQVGVAGATTIGNGVTLWGQVGVNKTIHLGDNIQVLGQSGVTASLAPGKMYMGYPAEEASVKRREFVWIKRIANLWDRVAQLEKRIEG